MDDIFTVCDRVMALFQGTNFAEATLSNTSRDEVIGWIMEAFFAMGDIVLKDMHLISKNLKPKFCKRAELKTVGLLASKPVAIN